MSYTNSKTFVITCHKEKTHVTARMQNMMKHFNLSSAHIIHTLKLLYAIGMLSYITSYSEKKKKKFSQLQEVFPRTHLSA